LSETSRRFGAWHGIKEDRPLNQFRGSHTNLLANTARTTSRLRLKAFGPAALAPSDLVHEGSKLGKCKGCTTFVGENDDHIAVKQETSGLDPSVAERSGRGIQQLKCGL
jgi:hypothetical protein